ncbi:putative oxidoreductase [Aureimonas endophytica]|uniref:Oxidoreductase n=1 Tax=Aureimonas endophytica TaxID=2027858 RepID=A0A917DZT8_9HYPH|nr:Gfo/Idh/MocA family oxidoreductase [Aureimonas endophytica]GGD86498.1 putative oxidoreductase [Aureimonas endophytica]
MAEASIGWAIAGTGAIAQRFAADMRHAKRGRVVAIASRNADRARRLAGAIGPEVRAGGLDAILADPAVTAVYVAGRNEDHRAVALRALRVGKPVLVEKPFATRLAEAEEIAEAASGAGLFAMEAMWMRFTPGFRRLKALVDRGAVGEIRSIRADLSFRNDRIDTPPLLDLGVYPLSLVLALVGAPTSVVAAETADRRSASLVLSYPNALASFSCGFAAEGANELVVTGTDGVLTAASPFFCPSLLTLRRMSAASQPSEGLPSALPDRPRLPWLGSAKAMLRPLRARRFPIVFEGSGLQYQADHVAECLTEGRLESPVMPLAASLEALRLIEAAQRQLAS